MSDDQPKIPKKPTAAEILRKVEQGDHIYNSCFASLDGAKVLKDLEDRFMMKSSIVSGDPYATHAKEGAREVVLYILKRIKGAQNARVDE